MAEKTLRPRARPTGLGTKTDRASLRPRSRPDPEKMAGLANVEFRADMDKILSEDPISRLGFDISRMKYEVPEGVNNAFYMGDYPLEDGMHGEVHSGKVLSFEPDTVSYGPDVGSSKDVIAHETRHRGLALLRDMLNEDPKFFKKKYGIEAANLLDEEKFGEELLVELFDDPDAEFIAPTTGETKKLESTISQIDTEFLRESDKRGFLPLDSKLATNANAKVINKGIAGLRFAAQDMLRKMGEPKGYSSTDISASPIVKPRKKEEAIEEENFFKKFFKRLGFDEGGLVEDTEEYGFTSQMSDLGMGFSSPDIPTETTEPSKQEQFSTALKGRPGFRSLEEAKGQVSKEELVDGLNYTAEMLVPFYEAGGNMVNVVSEYSKPEEERDYDYIKEELGKAGSSAAIEAGMLLLGGAAIKYGSKGIKALGNKIKQYEIDPNTTSMLGTGAIKKKSEEMVSVFPKPERMFPEGQRPKGGDYLNPATGEVLSGRNVSSANIKINPDGKPSFKVSNDNVESVGSVGKGKTQIKTNLFKKKAGWKWSSAPEGMEDIGTLISVENKGKHFYTIETDFSKGVNLKKYPNSPTEPRLRPTVIGELELGPQIGSISVRGKEHPVYQSIRTFNEGGTVMKDQMQLAFAFGGDVEIDAESGNSVPPGSTPKEVRDDIPAMLSEGEYVVPADVVRYYGVKFFEDLREEAKEDFAQMEAEGRIGGEPVREDDDDLTEDEMALLQEVMTMSEGGTVRGMSDGGDVGQKDAFGNPIGNSPSVPTPVQSTPLLQPVNITDPNIYGLNKAPTDFPTTSVPIVSPTPTPTPTEPDTQTGMKTVFYIHKDGRRISVLMLNGRPISSVPDDFNDFVEDTPENRESLYGPSVEDTLPETVAETAPKDSGKDKRDVPEVSVKRFDMTTPEGLSEAYKDSGVDVKDTYGAARKALDDAIKIPKAAGVVAGLVSTPIGLGLGIINTTSQLKAVSKAQANKLMAEFLGKEEEAKKIETDINNFVKAAGGAVDFLDEIAAPGTARFNNARQAALSMEGPEESAIFYDELTEAGKKNVNEYLLETSPGYKGATIGEDGIIRRESGAVDTSLRPRTRPDGISPAAKTESVSGVEAAKAAKAAKAELIKNDPSGDRERAIRDSENRGYTGSTVGGIATGNIAGAGQVQGVKADSSGKVVKNDEGKTVFVDSSGNEYVKDFLGKKTTPTGGSYDGPGDADKGGSAGSSGGGCFLTTAIVDRRGEADDGPTLTKLRNFRDTYMAAIPSDVEEYYHVAPQIVASIPEDHKDWNWIGTQIDKSVEFIDNNLLDDAYKTYKAMVNKLKKDWL